MKRVDEQGRLVAILAYITIIGYVLAVVIHSGSKTSLGAFHLRQSLGLYLIGLLLGPLNVIPVLGTLAAVVGAIFVFAFWLMGLFSAINYEEKPVPLIGEFIQEQFRNLF